MSTIERNYVFENYLNKSIKSTMASTECFSEEESDSSNSTKSFNDQRFNRQLKKREDTAKKDENDSDNDSLIEYSKSKNKNKKVMMPVETEKKQKSLYKTELCRNWEETGQCRYGMKCQYAHGAQDLREIERHPKYKTQKCRTFHKTGSCPYGARCTFRHFSLPGDALEMKNLEEEENAAPIFFEKTPTFPMFEEQKIFPWYSSPFAGEQFRRPLAYDMEDSLLPSNAESLLPHQLLFDLDRDEQQPYTNLSQIPNYEHYPSNDETLCKSFFRPWLM